MRLYFIILRLLKTLKIPLLLFLTAVGIFIIVFILILRTWNKFGVPQGRRHGSLFLLGNLLSERRQRKIDGLIESNSIVANVGKFRSFKYSRVYNDVVTLKGGHFEGGHGEDEMLIVAYNRFHAKTLWLDDRFTTDGIFYRLQTGGIECPKKCVVSNKREMADEAHALLFSYLDNRYRPQVPVIPKNRPRNQFWIAYTREPSNYHIAVKSYNDFPLDYSLNWTASFRRDSDIFVPYGFFEKIETPNGQNESTESSSMVGEKLIKKSKRPIAALISNCNAASLRDNVIKVLSKHISVDIYGKCGSPCPVPFGATNKNLGCRKYLADNYKFFLAFENSLCEDYVTEKVFEVMELGGMVPVVYGLANYSQIAPPNSYINFFDFSSIKDLAKYLRHLDQNDNEYNKYFDWRRDYRVRSDYQKFMFCNICVKLWAANGRHPRKEYFSFKKWWNSKKQTFFPPTPTPPPNMDNGTTCLDARVVLKKYLM